MGELLCVDTPTKLAAGHGQSHSDRELFSCLIPQRQAHVVNRDGGRRLISDLKWQNQDGVADS